MSIPEHCGRPWQFAIEGYCTLPLHCARLLWKEFEERLPGQTDKGHLWVEVGHVLLTLLVMWTALAVLDQPVDRSRPSVVAAVPARAGEALEARRTQSRAARAEAAAAAAAAARRVQRIMNRAADACTALAAAATQARTIARKGSDLPDRYMRRIRKAEPCPGLTVTLWRYVIAQGVGSNVWCTRWRRGESPFTVRPALAKQRLVSRHCLSDVARAEHAVVAINGSFFSCQGHPLSAVCVDARLMSVPRRVRTCLGILPGGRVIVGQPDFEGWADTSRGRFPIRGVNHVRRSEDVVLFTPAYGLTTATPTEGHEVAVAEGRVVATAVRNATIPRNGFVIAARGRGPGAFASLEPGDRITVDVGFESPWSGAKHVIGGGPRLVREGRVSVEYREEGFTKAFANTAAPRTAVGVTRGGTLMVVAVDGRDAPRNAGVSLDELAQIMVRLGCVNGMNLDGGGSTTLCVAGRVLNRPSCGVERPINTALVIVPTPAPIPPSAPGDGRQS